MNCYSLHKPLVQYTGQTPPAPTRGAAPKQQAEGEDDEVQEEGS